MAGLHRTKGLEEDLVTVPCRRFLQLGYQYHRTKQIMHHSTSVVPATGCLNKSMMEEVLAKTSRFTGGHSVRDHAYYFSFDQGGKIKQDAIRKPHRKKKTGWVTEYPVRGSRVVEHGGWWRSSDVETVVSVDRFAMVWIGFVICFKPCREGVLVPGQTHCAFSE